MYMKKRDNFFYNYLVVQQVITKAEYTYTKH